MSPAGPPPFRPMREPAVDTVKYRPAKAPSWVSRPRPKGTGRNRRPSDDETRINRRASQRTTNGAIRHFLIATTVSWLFFAFTFYVFGASYDASTGFFEAVFEHFGIVTFAGFLSGCLWTLYSLVRGRTR